MKFKKILTGLVLSSLLVCSSAFAADLSKLIIIHTNDTHGFDQRADGINGIACIKELKDDFTEKGYDVLLVDAGDAIQDNNLVNISKGAVAVKLFNAAGYDAAALGNHEFDYGQDVLEARMKEAKYPYVAANIIVEATGKTYIKPATIVQKGNVKVGIFGLSTPETMVSTNPKNVRGLKFLDNEELYKCAQKQVDELKAAGCDVIVTLGHIGSTKKAGYATAEDIIANVKGIDIFVDGHDHKVKNFDNPGSALHVSTGSYTRNIGVVKYQNGKWVSDAYAFGRFNKEDDELKRIVDEAQSQVDKAMSQKVAKIGFAMSGERVPGVRTKEMPLGDLVTDAFLWQARQANVLSGKEVDAAVLNGGAIRKGIDKGTITRGTASAILPYNNQLYVITVPGAVLHSVLETSTCVTPEEMGGFPQVSGIEYVLDSKVPFARGEKYEGSEYYKPAKPGSRLVIKTVNGKPFDPKTEYNIVAIEFLCNGGDSYAAFMPYAAKNSRSIGYIDTDAFMNYLKTELGGVVPERYKKSQGRITIK
ncbi:MAG: bifunctional UDP-sugar hydrolase/5'-nucleotidase [Phascolarctobacterium sp.]|nr:bifunctional UDP-sugar hydrolase/5'-nucleotidase [Phascolarctobacterium sp.]